MSGSLANLVFILGLTVIAECTRVPFFRRDYKYVAATDSFYKMHTLHKTWEDARKQCKNEGASLFYPEDENEANAILQFWNQTQPQFYWVFIGVSASLVPGVFETDDGTSIDEIYNKWDFGEPNNLNEKCLILRRTGFLNDDNCGNQYPFICKKTAASVEWNTLCDLPDKHYLYHSVTGKCYKFHQQPAVWADAFSLCSTEQSYLAVINSQTEANELVELVSKYHKDNVRVKDFLSGVVLLGFHVKPNEEWRTIKGTTLADSGYEKWNTDHPEDNDTKTCGSMSYDGLLNDVSCNAKAFYICEHDIATLSNSLDDRFTHTHKDCH